MVINLQYCSVLSVLLLLSNSNHFPAALSYALINEPFPEFKLILLHEKDLAWVRCTWTETSLTTQIVIITIN